MNVEDLRVGEVDGEAGENQLIQPVLFFLSRYRRCKMGESEDRRGLVGSKVMCQVYYTVLRTARDSLRLKRYRGENRS